MSTESKTPYVQDFVVASPNCRYETDHIEADYTYETTVVETDAAAARHTVRQVAHKYTFRTDRRVPKTGLLYIGLGGNNGSTLVAGILANKKKLTWNTKTGPRQADYYGSLTQCSTVRLGTTATGEQVYVPFNKVLPMVNPNDLVVHGWDISAMPLGDAMTRACVLDYDVQRQLRDEMNEIVPMPSIYYPSFIAANQSDRADNVLPGTDKQVHLDTIRKNIRDFKAKHQLDKVIVAWVANTERFADVQVGLNDTAANLLASIKASHDEVSPSTIFAVAAIQEGCSFINGSPQNTFVPGVMELAEAARVFIGGDDLKTGQTKMKSVLVDYLVSAGLKPVSVVSYNHLGNNDGKNLSAPEQFRSKEISKSNVVDDMVASNRILFQEGEHPDHLVVIKYVPYVRDSKRALDEYTSEIFMGGLNTISMHNTCEDSLLAVPIILDLVILAELMERVTYKTQGMTEFERTEPILSILSFLLKAPVVPKGSPVINSFFRQHECIVNFMRACVGLPPDNNLLLESKTKLKL